MLRLYKQPTSKHLFKRTAISFLVLVLIFTSVNSVVLLKNHYETASAANCGDVFDPLPSWLTTRLDQNKAVYVQVANEKGIPWEMLAAVHYREFNMAVSNPANGQGIYQLYSSGQYFTPGAVSRDEFVHQTRLAADFLQAKATNSGTRTAIVIPRYLTTYEGDLNLIKNTLFSYNGRAQVYAQQAAQLGYNPSSQPFEGSPYVMNKFDCQRKSMGIITNDGGSTLNGTDTRMGAFTLYARLKSDSYWGSLQVGNIPGCTQATNTTLACVWRLYNTGTKKYTYTTSFDERNRLIANGYLYNGVVFFGNSPLAPRTGNIPVYEVRNGDGASLLTTSAAEYTHLKNIGWLDKGILIYADPAGSNSGYQVYRFYVPSTQTHIFTSVPEDIIAYRNAGQIEEGISFAAISPLAQEQAAPSGQSLVYRFSGMPNNGHFWTKDINERDSMIRAGYRYERTAWKSHANTTPIAIYRLYSPGLKTHLYTKDNNERATLKSNGLWVDEGVAWHASQNQNSSPVYRLYSSFNQRHFYTTDANERSILSRSGVFKDEGIAWYQPQ